MANYNTGGGELRFYKSNGITTYSVPLVVWDKIWYLERDITSTLYQVNIGTSSNAFVRAITRSALNNICHH